MMYLSKEATNKDQCLKMQMMLSLDKEDSANNSEKIWSSNGFFGDAKVDFTIKKPIFPENTLVYFEDIKTTNKLFRVFVSIFIRVYLNYILSLLNEVEFSEYQATLFR